jgi:transposase
LESELLAHRTTIEDYFRTNPPATIKEAAAKIYELTGIQRSESSIRAFLKRIGIQRRKVGHIPAKADVEAQEAFKKTVTAKGAYKLKLHNDRLLE